jgi:hypothetical protein
MSDYTSWYDAFVAQPRDKAKEGTDNDTLNK